MLIIYVLIVDFYLSILIIDLILIFLLLRFCIRFEI